MASYYLNDKLATARELSVLAVKLEPKLKWQKYGNSTRQWNAPPRYTIPILRRHGIKAGEAVWRLEYENQISYVQTLEDILQVWVKHPLTVTNLATDEQESLEQIDVLNVKKLLKLQKGQNDHGRN